MSNIIKHCGVMNNTGSRVYVFYRQLEEEPDNCLFVYRDSLPDVYSDAVHRFVMGEGQRSVDLYTVAHSRGILDGQNMLTLLYRMGYLRKAKTSDITMHVTQESRIPLNVLNDEIAGVTSTQVSTVKKDSPFDDFEPELRADNSQFSSAIVKQLVEQARGHKQAYDALIKRATSLDPSIETVFTETSEDKESTKLIEVSSGIFESNGRFYLEVGDLPKTKLTQLLNDAVKIIRERK